MLLAWAAGAAPGGPSRKVDKGCAWRKLSDPALGLEAWVQRCDYGTRKIDFETGQGALRIRFSDAGGKTEPVVEVLALAGGETPEAGLRRIFVQHTDRKVAARCVLRPYTEGTTPAAVKRFTFVPDAAYQKELDARHEDGVPDPPCGDWGTTADGIQYFETQPATGARKVLFVRVGQDEPLFDEATLRLLPPPR
jgi:hypothetical protein